VTSAALLSGLALAVALVVGGAVAALTAANAMKKIAALMLAFVGAALSLALLGAPGGAILAVVAIAFAHTAIGVSIAVRLQEAYGGVETGELDAADEEDEPREPET